MAFADARALDTLKFEGNVMFVHVSVVGHTENFSRIVQLKTLCDEAKHLYEIVCLDAAEHKILENPHPGAYIVVGLHLSHK